VIECDFYNCLDQVVKLDNLTKIIKFYNIVFKNMSNFQIELNNLELVYFENILFDTNLVNTTFLKITNPK
jgi:hypothetical protein